MTVSHPHCPATLGLFQKRIEGDDCLMELARHRFQQAGMGAEMHAGTVAELEWCLGFLPSRSAPPVVHLPGGIPWDGEDGQRRILEFAGRFAGRVRGLVVHDRIEMGVRPGEFVRAARALESQLARVDASPLVFIEYAAGLEPSAFVEFFGAIRDLSRVCACIDIGHAGIRQARNAYARLHAGEDICALKFENDRLPVFINDVDKAVETALPRVLMLIEAVGRIGRQVHFHLHDGHPLSRSSPFGVSDHLSFLDEIPIAFEHHGRRSLPLMFGPAGLSRIAATAVGAIGREQVSFTLEIHPSGARLPLGDAAPMFSHWRDKTNAEKMNHWLSVLGQNHDLLLKGVEET